MIRWICFWLLPPYSHPFRAALRRAGLHAQPGAVRRPGTGRPGRGAGPGGGVSLPGGGHEAEREDLILFFIACDAEGRRAWVVHDGDGVTPEVALDLATAAVEARFAPESEDADDPDDLPF